MPRQPLASFHKAFPMLRSLQEFPNEIVQQIFAVFATTLSTEKLTLFPWFLGHIYSTWRYLFLSMTTAFWHRISIKFITGKYERTVDVVRFFLQRDPAAPLSFNLMSAHGLSEYDLQAAEYIRQTMEMLVDESVRWENASFNFCAQDLLPLIRAKNRLPLLQDLDLWFFQGSNEEIPNALYDVFQNAPSLDVVSTRFLADWKFSLLDLKDIRVYELASGASKFVAALPQMTKLERLVLDCSPNDVIPSGTIVLPNLTNLNCDAGLLRFLQTPALEDLFIDHEKYDSNDIVLSFLRRSSCGSKISRLGITSAQASTVIEIIKYTPQIVHLDLVEIINAGDVFKQLAIPTNFAQEPLVARHLLSLHLSDFEGASDNDMSLLSDLISSRTISSTNYNCGYKRLQKLKIYGYFFHVSLAAQTKVMML